MHGKVGYTLYYHAEFSKPLKNVGVWSATLPPGPYNCIIAEAGVRRRLPRRGSNPRMPGEGGPASRFLRRVPDRG